MVLELENNQNMFFDGDVLDVDRQNEREERSDGGVWPREAVWAAVISGRAVAVEKAGMGADMDMPIYRGGLPTVGIVVEKLTS